MGKTKISDQLYCSDLKYKRIIMWHFNQYLNSVEFEKMDTAFNENFYDYKFLKKDAGGNLPWSVRLRHPVA